MTDVFLLNATMIAMLMLVTWLASLWLQDASIVDPVWGFGFVVVAWTSFLAAPLSEMHVLPPLLATIWGLRLCVWLAWRNYGKPEDFRYRAMREKHGHRFPVTSLVTVFAVQGAVMWVVSLPLQTGQGRVQDGFRLETLGTSLWSIGLFFESVGDWQLAQFKNQAANVGRVMDRGLWRFTRQRLCRRPDYPGAGTA